MICPMTALKACCCEKDCACWVEKIVLPLSKYIEGAEDMIIEGHCGLIDAKNVERSQLDKTLAAMVAMMKGDN